MDAFSVLVILPAVCYGIFLSWCLLHWNRSIDAGGKATAELPRTTLLIAVRNEARGIASTISCIARQRFPLDRLELIVLDDDSTDDTCNVVEKSFCEFPGLNARLIRIKGAGSKKAVLQEGVSAASGEWIVTTDGDTLAGPEWLSTLLQPAADARINLICGPVLLKSSGKQSLLITLVRMESMVLALIAGAGIHGRSPFFCNAANMAYRRAYFLSIGGYNASATRLSGDDTDLLRKQHPEAIRYVKRQVAIVTAAPAESVGGFIRQRQRWASKIPVTLSRWTFFWATVVWLMNAFFLAGPAFVFTGFLSCSIYGAVAIFKLFIDARVLKASAKFFGERTSFALLLILSPCYALAVSVIGLISLLLPYRWKGRTGR